MTEITVTLALLQALAKGKHEFPYKGVAYCYKEDKLQIYNFGLLGDHRRLRWIFGEIQERKLVRKHEWVKI